MILLPTIKRNFSSQLSKTFVSAILQRNPIVQKPLNDFEKQYQLYMKMIQNESSRGIFKIPNDLKSEINSSSNDKSLTHPSSTTSVNNDALSSLISLSANNNIPSDHSLSSSSKDITMIEPEWTKIANSSNKSLNRLLDKKLYFTIKNRSDQRWMFPTLPHPGNATALYEISRKCISHFYGDNIDVYYLGRFPVAHFALENLPSERTFFWKAQILPPNVGLVNSELCDDYAWLSKDELAERLDPAYYKAIQSSLIDA